MTVDTELPQSPLVVRASALRAHADAAAIRAEAEAQREEERRHGREQGLREGLAEAARLAAGMATAVDAFWAEREGELQDLAFAIAHRILSSLPPAEVLARIAREAVAEHRSDVRLALRVPPGDADALRAALGAVDPEGRVSVESDPAAAPGACTLVHPRGRTELGLLDQFRALMRGAA